MFNYHKELNEVELHRWQLAVLENYYENNQFPVLFDSFLLNEREKAHVNISYPSTKTHGRWMKSNKKLTRQHLVLQLIAASLDL